MANASDTGDDFPNLIGGLYAQWTLDCLIELGWAVSIDFVTRPQLYISKYIPHEILQLRMGYGTQFPNTTQRQTMVVPILGTSDGLKPGASGGSSSFQTVRNGFMDACQAFAAGPNEKRQESLESVVRTASAVLRDYFRVLKGTSVQLTAKQMNDVSNVVMAMLRASGVASVFGISSPPASDWPFVSTDGNGALLVGTASATLPVPQQCKLGYPKFQLLQRVAQEGERALRLALTTQLDDRAELLHLITQGYSWRAALSAFQQTL